jgi:hypothetical protein
VHPLGYLIRRATGRFDSSTPTILMRTPRDQHVIEHWFRLYNRLTSASRATVWPYTDSSQKYLDPVCMVVGGHSIAQFLQRGCVGALAGSQLIV